MRSAFLVVDLFEHCIRQFHFRRSSSTSARIACVWKIFTTCFEPAKIIPVPCLLGFAVCPEQNSILIIEEEFSGAAGLTALFGFAGTA
jgi:hypothetical protein